MNLVTKFAQKYPFISSTLEIYTENIFYYLQKLNIPGYTLIVCDGNSHTIAKHYQGKFNILCMLPHKRALPTTQNANYILNACKQNNIKQIISFGTGAINDLCKFACHELKIKYIFVPTALSMNGIVSNNTSLYSEGNLVKQSFNASAASIILLDETILTAAPIKFIGSAIMDSLAAFTAHHDMLFAHKQNPKEYSANPITFEMFNKQISLILQIIEENVDLIYNNYETILQVFDLLYLSGIIMNYYGTSIAFSGGEHNIAHTLESRNPHLKTEFLHGEIISAILPFYSSLQMEYNGNNYISKQIVTQNIGEVDFIKIAKKLGMQSSYQEIGILEDEFIHCIKTAKTAKNRPTLLNLLF